MNVNEDKKLINLYQIWLISYYSPRTGEWPFARTKSPNIGVFGEGKHVGYSTENCCKLAVQEADVI